MAYLELSKEAYNDIIQAAGMKGAKVSRVCEEQGVWSAEAKAEAPDDVAEPDDYAEGTRFHPSETVNENPDD